jgi:SagB-type dehydrogenase family enzyme
MPEDDRLGLPGPAIGGPGSFERTVARRRSVREFSRRKLSRVQIAQLCWAGQGVTNQDEGLRAAPSAGALYPVELYAVTGEGVDRYVPAGHRMCRHLTGDVRPLLQKAALDQEMVGDAPFCLAIAVVASRVSRKYGRRAERYCLIEVGHVAQNVLLQADSLGLAAVPIGAFADRRVARILHVARGHRVVYLIAIGLPRRR